ncbi:echinoidin-like [Glandiceps talaboti]
MAVVSKSVTNIGNSETSTQTLAIQGRQTYVDGKDEKMSTENAPNTNLTSPTFMIDTSVDRSLAQSTTITKPGSDHDCDPLFVPFGNSCYRFINSLKTWTDASDTCRVAHDADHVSIHSHNEQLFVDSLIDNTVWLGLNDLSTEGYFRWSDGTTLNYTKWADGEPNDYNGHEDCAVHSHSNKMWNDIPCDLMMAFVCKKPN